MSKIEISDILTDDFKNQMIEIQNESFIELFKKSDNILIELELFKLKSIQDYLLTRGHNDEEINEKLRNMNNKSKTTSQH